MAEPRITEHALPGVLAEIARLTTPAIAVAIAREHGGRAVYIPRDLSRKHALAKLVGVPAARLICRAIGGDHHRIPSARSYLRWHDVRRLKDQSKSHAQISKALGISVRQVGELLKGYVPSDQPSEASEPADTSHCPVCGHRHHAGAGHRPDPRQFALEL